MTQDFEEFRPMVHDLYSGERAMLRAIKNMPTLRLLKRETDWRARDYIRPLWDETPQAVGHDISTVLDVKTVAAAQVDAWEFTHKKLYGAVSIDRLALETTKGDAKNFLKVYTAAVDGTMKTLAKELSTKIFRGQACPRSTVSAVANGDGTNDRVTLANREDVIHFYVGMEVVFSDAGGAPGATLHTPSSGRLTVNKIDRKDGYLYFTNGKGGSAVNLSTGMSTAVAAGDYIHRRGDVTSSSAALSLCGFESFILSAADRASPGTFKGVDRTQDVDRRGGMNLASAGRTMEDTLIEALVRAQEQNVEFTHFIMHPKRLGQLVREVDSKLVRDDGKTSALIGKRAFNVMLAAGETTVLADPFCQVDKVWGINRDDLILKSVGEFIRHIDDDVMLLRETSSDSYECRMGGYGELTWSYPGTHMHIEIT